MLNSHNRKGKVANECPKCQTNNPNESKFCMECATPLPWAKEVVHTKTLETPIEELTTGSTFAGRYQIIEELGIGGMGRVYKVLDQETNERIALKLIKPEIATDKKAIERFRNELTTARKIVQKNVCRMYDLNKEKENCFITMEYISGQDLKGLIRQTGQLIVGKAISIAKQICDGLSEAHRLGVVHRDLKPSNIMIDKEGNARIMDFGIARSIKEKGITGTGIMIGTPEYMSPEQVEAKEVDFRSDIYSLGIILYEMVTGRLPFKGDTALSIAMKHKGETPKDPKDLNPQIPEDLNQLILKCMEKDKEHRYQTVEQILYELDNIEKDIPTTQREITKKRPLTSKEITVSFSLKKIFIPALGIAAVLIVVLFLWHPWSQKKTVPIPSDKPFLAVLSFKNNTGDEGLDHWRTMFSDLLIADLSQSKYLEVLSGEKLFKILSDLNQQETKSYSSDILKQVAAQGGVNHIVVGNYAKAGETIRINVTLQEVQAEKILASEGVEGKGEESLFTMVDELTRRIKANFNFSQEQIANDIDIEVGKITTSAPEAYKYYSEGRKVSIKGDYRQAIPFLEKAVEIDPEFAMAYRALAGAYRNIGEREESKKNLEKALELSDRVSVRERYLIQADFYRVVEVDYDKAIIAYEKLLELYPDIPMALNNLGIIYAGRGERDKAIKYYELAYQKNKTFTIAKNLAFSYQIKGLYAKAREIWLDYFNNVSDNASIHIYLANNYISDGKLDLAAEEADKAIMRNPKSYNKSWIYYLQGDFVQMEKECEEMLESEDKLRHIGARSRLEVLYRTQGQFEKAEEQVKFGLKLAEEESIESSKRQFYYQLAYIYFITGKTEEALKEANKVWKSAVENWMPYDQINALMMKIFIYLEMKSPDNAQTAADELKELLDKNKIKEGKIYHSHALGEIELEKENYSKAIEYFKKSLSPVSYAPFRIEANFIEPLALAYYKAGNLEEAGREYEKITSLTWGRQYYGEIYAKSFSMLGKIYEQQGDTSKAIEFYKKFLSLWKDADPGLPEFDDAKKKLAELQKSPLF